MDITEPQAPQASTQAFKRKTIIMNFTRSLFIAAALISTGSAALAQATIDQNKALAGGSLPGDSAGFPITITQPGSYKLMSNLVVPNGVNGIEIKTPNVTLDLNGFTVSGPRTCTWAAASKVVTCSGGSGNNYGIADYSGAATDLVVRNGSVKGFVTGVIMTNGRVENMAASHNQNTGFQLGTTSGNFVQASNLTATLNGGNGITTAQGLIDFATTFRNGGFGILGTEGTKAVVSNILSYENHRAGMAGVTARATSMWGNVETGLASIVSIGGANISDGVKY